MPRISTYASDTVDKSDKLIGTSSSGGTKNFEIQDISKFFKQTNAAGVAGQFTYKYKTSGASSGNMSVTFSTGATFEKVTSIKVNKFVFGETDSSENLLDVLSSRQLLIVDTDDQDNYGIFNSGVVTRDGTTDFYDISLTATTKHNGSFINDRFYAIISIGGGADKNDFINFSTTTFVDEDGNDQTETLSGVTYFYFNFDHNLGKKPSITVTEAGSPDVKAFVPVKYINDNRVRVYFTGKTNGKVYAN